MVEAEPTHGRLSMRVRHRMSVQRGGAERDAPGAPETNGARKGVPTVNYMTALLLADPERFQSGNAPTRTEAITSKPGLGDKVRSVFQGLRSRLAVDAVPSPATPALLDYPYRS